MKKTIHILYSFFIIILFSSTLLADGGSNDSCANPPGISGELISELNNRTILTTHTESGTVKKNDSNKDKDDYYYFDISDSGTIKVVYSSDQSTDFYFSKDTNGCDHDKELNNGTSKTTTLSVTSGQRIYIRIKDEGNGLTPYSMNFTFTPTNADLSITKTVNNSTPNIGDTVEFTIVGRNNGTSDSEFRITDTLPTGLSFDTSFSGDGVSENRSSFSCSTSGQTATCQGGRDYSTGDTVTVRISAVVSGSGTITNTASIVSRDSVPDTDTSNNNASAILTIPVPNAVPTANAGSDQTIATLGDSVNLLGSGSDTDGTIAGYVWKEGATTLSTSASFNYTPATLGAHTLTLTVTDNGGAIGTDTVIITVNTPPIANAGTDQTIIEGDTVTFDGVLSNDSDGNIVSYVWNYVNTGVQLTTGVNGTYDTGANNVPPGTYEVRLTVTDDDGTTATDIVSITITAINTPNISIDPTTVSIPEGTASLDFDVNLNVAANKGAITVNYGGTCGVNNTVIIPKGDTSKTFTVNSSGFAVGSCTIILNSATGSNGQLVGSRSPDTSTITVTVAPLTDSFSVTSSSDDAEERVSNGNVDIDSGDLEMAEDDGNTQIVGIRFLVNIPAGASITKAYIKFQADGSNSGSTSLNIYAQDSGSSNTFVESSNNISNTTNRPRTSAIPWNTIPAWTENDYYDTPDLKNIVQTVISRGDWTNSSLTFIITGSGERQAESYDASGDAPVLHLEYTVNPPPVADAGSDQYVEVGDNITFDGSGSSDDGSISSYSWSEGGSEIATGENPTYINGFSTTGIYTVTLTVTDDEGATGQDDVIIAVSGPGNDAPIITSNGGGDTATITIGASDLLVTHVHAVDPDGNTITYSISGGTDNSKFSINTTSGELTLNVVGTPSESYIVNVTASDTGGASDTQVITVIIDDPLVSHEGDRPFTVRNPDYTRNIRGNYAIIGNSNQCALDTKSTSSLSGNCYNSFSNSRPSRYIDIDSDGTTVNSTSSTLTTADIPADATVLWAGLYWQGVVHRSIHSGDFMGEEGSYNGVTIPDSEPKFSSGRQINFSSSSSTYGAEEVRLKLPGESDYIEITASQLDFSDLGYAGFKDITHLISSTNFNGTYTLAEIKSHQGVETNHGNYAAWSIVVIYRHSSETSKNITLFDGYATVDSGFNQDLVMDGFLTPSIPPIESKLAFFAMDGDNGTTSLEIISENGVSTFATNQDTPSHNLFDATISDSITRNTDSTSLRTDLKVLDFTDVLGPTETKATLKPRSNGDRYTPSFFIMSADLRVPKLCYDYSVTTADGTIFTDDPKTNPLHATQFGHEVTSANFNGEEHIVKIYIRSKDGDLELENVTVGVTDFNTTRIRFDRGEISHNGNFAYIPVSPTVTNPDPFLPFGNDDVDFSDGGTIEPEQSFYGKFYFETTGNGGDLDEYINFTVVTHLDFGSGLAEFTSSTKDINNPLERCERDPVYDPSLGQFSVERIDATHNAGTETERYPLYTQIVENPFEVSVVAQDVSTSGNTLPPLLSVSEIGVELELFKAGSFDNNASSGFDILCEDYDRSNILENKFIAFDSTPRTYIDVPEFTPNKALRNAAFRVWYITDINGSMVFDNECYRTSTDAPNGADDNCFAGKYNTEVRAILDPNSIFCEAECVTGTSGCYECIKTTFGSPVCSRDNFSIRPAALHVKLDDGDSTNPPIYTVMENNVSYSTPPKLAAGYPYPGEINALNYAGTNIAPSYYANFATAADPDNNINEAKFAFVDNTNALCADVSDLPIASGTIHIRDGELSEDINITGKNAGEYILTLNDNTWTIVDQSSYEFMTPFDGNEHVDCIEDDATTANAIFGCDVSSNVASATGRTDTFSDLNIDFRPYGYNLDNISFNTEPDNSNRLFMTDFSDPYYDIFTDDVMSVKIEGNISAVDYTNTIVLSNYTTGCTAEDSLLQLDINITSSSLDISNINHILVYDTLSSIKDTNAISKSGDENMTLAKAAFDDSANGFADIIIYTTFKKPASTARQSPVIVNYNKINMHGVNDTITYVEKTPNYQPEGNQTLDGNVTFYYGKITPKELLYETSSSSIQTPIYVDIFCDEGNCTGYGLVEDSKGENYDTGDWYSATIFNDDMLGTTDLGIATISPLAASPSVTPNNDVDFDDGTSQEDIIVDVTGDNRPTTVRINFTPVPWLIDDSTTDAYRVKFLDNSAWSGVGNTGNVNRTTSTKTPSNRMSW